MFPTLSYLHSNRNNPVFDVRRTPSNVGAIPEYFRTEYPALRSLCPTHSCAAVGLRAEYLTGSAPSGRYALRPQLALSPPAGRGRQGAVHRLRDASEYVDARGRGAEPSAVPVRSARPLSNDRRGGADIYCNMRVARFAGVSQRYERLVPLLPAGGYAAANVHTAFCELIDAAEMWRTGGRAATAPIRCTLSTQRNNRPAWSYLYGRIFETICGRVRARGRLSRQ